MPTLPSITIWQPWTTLIILGAKPYEFRGWPAPRRYIGQRIGIHAGARVIKPDEIRDLIMRLKGRDPWTTCLRKEIALPLLEKALVSPGILVRSHMLGTAVLGAPVRGTDVIPEFGGQLNDSDRHQHANFAWPLTEIQPLEPPVPAKGAQGFWNWQGA